jgi:hypothetical protein
MSTEHLVAAALARLVLQSPMQTAGMAGMALLQASLEHLSPMLVEVVALVMQMLAEVQMAQAERVVVVVAIKMPLVLLVLQILEVVVVAAVVIAEVRFKVAATEVLA